MANEQNLIRNEDLTPKQRRANARKAGKASAAKRKERKAMRELARIVLDMPASDGKLDDIESLAMADTLEANLTVGQKAVLAVARKAVEGDVVALTFLRDTAGEKPADKVEVSGEVAAAASDIKQMIAASKEKADDR